MPFFQIADPIAVQESMSCARSCIGLSIRTYFNLFETYVQIACAELIYVIYHSLMHIECCAGILCSVSMMLEQIALYLWDQSYCMDCYLWIFMYFAKNIIPHDTNWVSRCTAANLKFQSGEYQFFGRCTLSGKAHTHFGLPSDSLLFRLTYSSILIEHCRWTYQVTKNGSSL